MYNQMDCPIMLQKQLKNDHDKVSYSKGSKYLSKLVVFSAYYCYVLHHRTSLNISAAQCSRDQSSAFKEISFFDTGKCY